MTSPAKFAHIGLLTEDIARMRDWYCEVLQASVLFENEQICFTTYDEEHHRVVFVKSPDYTAPDDNSRVLHHMAFTYASLDDLLATYERLRDIGIKPWWTINHGPTLSFYYRDPDGNNAELQIDSMPMDQARDFGKSDIFAANPIGIPFDAEELVAKRRAGASVAELVACG